ncbi:MAG TPA: efflux RND transporter permease subunit [Myxococcota bacterium]|nr:efflux RND transporter permease subunit [Myxococcota bacterium]
MWIVRLALRRPYTFVVMAMLIGVLGTLSIATMPTDIFPSINVPVVSSVWFYGGLAPDEMQNRITTIVERATTTTVNDIQHIESVTLRGVTVIKVFLQPGASPEAGVAQINAISNTLIRPLPPGITPPLILQYNAASVPVLLLSLSSDTLSDQEINDLGSNFIRTQLVTVNGASIPPSYGGKSRQIMADLDTDALYARGLSPQDVSNALGQQNVILPAGTAKMGVREYDVALNGSPQVLADLDELPVKAVNGAVVKMRDVAHVHDGFSPQTNMIRRDGKHAVMLSVQKSGRASTLAVVQGVKDMMPRVMAGMPPALKVDLLFDQSLFVRAAIGDVLREGAIAAGLTALMILLFLGSPRSTVIVATSIPLSVLTSIVVLKAFNQTLNVMTLGGMALAVGILVDDATVEIENIHRNLAEHKPMRQAILDGAQQIATAAFVSTLSICIVFVPVFLLGGVVGSLFSPLALAVVAAMMASYLLSRTLIPTMVLYLLPGELAREAAHDPGGRVHQLTARAHERVNHAFQTLGHTYERALTHALTERRTVALSFGAFALASLVLVPFVGRDFFPTVDAGSLRLHLRGPTGTRLEETERYFQRVEDRIRQLIPPDELGVVLDNIGVPNGINLATTDSATVSAAEGEILVSLKPGHAPTASYLKKLRAVLPSEFPEITFFAQPADMVGQILNFGLPAPIDVQVSGPNAEQAHNYQFAQEIAEQVRKIPGAVDVHVHQVVDGPRLAFDVDRSLAAESGLSVRDVANSLLISLTGTGSTSTNFWLNPKNGVSYPVVIQSPQHRMASIGALQATPVTSSGESTPQILSGVATLSRTTTPVALNHYNVQPVYDVFANVQGSDLGSVADAVTRVVDEFRSKIPKASIITMRGQVQSMNEAFAGLGFGILFAIVLVYFLMVVNFQSWIDPAIILMALPGVVAGILWLLFATGTTLSVPSLMGAIMAIGVATSNSILLITFANQERHRGLDARAAALSAGRTRLRPVLMTALAMVIGMLPMSLGLGEGGEQNAPLGRAVIGGLTLATLYTLFFVPIAYSLLRQKPPKPLEDA